MDMARLRKPKTMTLDADIVARADAWIKRQPGGANFARLVDTALTEFLDRQEGGKARKRETSQAQTAKGTQDKEAQE